MTEALPHGIVFNTHSIRTQLNYDAHVEVEDVARLWRVYTTNKTTLEKDAGRRLENLFWRIWSNGRISCTIRGYTLAFLFIQISEGSYTTEEWLRKERELAGFRPKAIPLRFHDEKSVADSPSSQGPSRSNSSRLTTSGSGLKTQLPPSILKKPRPSSDEQLADSSTNGVMTSYSGDSLSQQSDRGSVRRKKTTFASNLTHSQEMEPGSLPKKINRPFPVRTMGSSDDFQPQSPPLKFRSPFDDSSVESPSRPPNPTPSSISKWPQFKNPFAANPQLTNSYTNEAGGLTSNIRMSANITPSDKQLLEEYLSNSPVNLDHMPRPEQPSSASLVDKGFRTRFVKRKGKEREQHQHVSSLTNLIDAVQQQTPPNHHRNSSSSSSPREPKLQTKSNPSPTSSDLSFSTSVVGINNSNSNPSFMELGATGRAPDVPTRTIPRSSISSQTSSRARQA